MSHPSNPRSWAQKRAADAADATVALLLSEIADLTPGVSVTQTEPSPPVSGDLQSLYN